MTISIEIYIELHAHKGCDWTTQERVYILSTVAVCEAKGVTLLRSVKK